MESLTDKLALFRARPQSELEPDPFPFASKLAENRQLERHENYREAAAELQRELDAAATLAAAESADPYLSLPLPIRVMYSKAEYLWLSDHEKATLLQRECEPEA